jgi:hypothetical protein
METHFEIVKTERCYFQPWKVYATFKCLQDCIAHYATFFDIKEYKVHADDYIRLKIYKRKCPVIGRIVSIEYLIEEAIKQNIFL